MYNRLRMLSILAAGTLAAANASAVSAAELAYYLTAPKGASPEERKTMKSPEGEAVVVAAEPVAVIGSDKVTDAVIVGEKLDMEEEGGEAVDEIFWVRLTVDEASKTAVVTKMDEVCKTAAGVHIAVDGTVVDYRPFAVCGRFETEVSFLDRAEAEKYAKMLSPRSVKVITPKAE